MNLPSQRIAAHAKAHQVELSLRADAAASAVDVVTARAWRVITSAIRRRERVPPQAFAALHGATRAQVFAGFRRVAAWTHKQIATAYRRAMPLFWLRFAAAKRLRLVESAEPQELLERDEPGVLRYALRALGLDFRAISFNDQRDAFAALLFPPPPEDEVVRIFQRPIAGMTWEDRLLAMTRRAQPAELSSVITTGYAQGKQASEIARDILPLVDGVRSVARRIARTGTMQIAHDIQRGADKGLEEAEMLVGWQTHSTLDEHTRPWHAKRNGTIYYLNPTGRQKGRAQMPEPPMEPEDASERPPGTPQLAHNCRCRNSPVLTAPDYLTTPEALAVFKNNEGKLIPDTVAYHDWFAQADERRRMRAVGVRRYNELRDEWAGKPPWEAFIDPDTGDLMPMARLRAESVEERAERAGEVRRVMDERRAKLRQVGLMGFELQVA